MEGYRKWIVGLVGVLATAVLGYLGLEKHTETVVTNMEAVINSIYTLIIALTPSAAGGTYMYFNVKAKKTMAANGNTVTTAPAPAVTMGIPPDDALAASLGAPLDIEKMLEQAENNRDKFFNYKFASTTETGLYFAFCDLGNATATASIQHSMEFFDKLIELAQASWLAETKKAVGTGIPWEEKDSKENLSLGYSPGCHALTSYSWAGKFQLKGLYRHIDTDIRAAQWLDMMDSQYPHLDVIAKFGANATLYRIGVNARGVVEAPVKKK